jgi:hypothetical protein
MDIWTWLSKLLGLASLPMFLICIFCAILLFLPHGALVSDTFVSRNRDLIGATCLFSGVMALAYPLRTGFSFFVDHRGFWLLKYAAKRRLRDLDNSERRILSQFIERNERTLDFNLVNNGVVLNLVGLGILYFPRKGKVYLPSVPVSIREWAWKELRRSPELLKAGLE